MVTKNGEIIILPLKTPKATFRMCKRGLNKRKLHIPKLPALKTNLSLVMSGLTTGLLAEVTNINSMRHLRTSRQNEKVIGAGRGGKYYSTGSHYSFI